jgi:hypothetical protein
MEALPDHAQMTPSSHRTALAIRACRLPLHSGHRMRYRCRMTPVRHDLTARWPHRWVHHRYGFGALAHPVEPVTPACFSMVDAESFSRRATSAKVAWVYLVDGLRTNA